MLHLLPARELGEYPILKGQSVQPEPTAPLLTQLVEPMVEVGRYPMLFSQQQECVVTQAPAPEQISPANEVGVYESPLLLLVEIRKRVTPLSEEINEIFRGLNRRANEYIARFNHTSLIHRIQVAQLELAVVFDEVNKACMHLYASVPKEMDSIQARIDQYREQFMESARVLEALCDYRWSCHKAICARHHLPQDYDITSHASEPDHEIFEEEESDDFDYTQEFEEGEEECGVHQDPIGGSPEDENDIHARIRRMGISVDRQD